MDRIRIFWAGDSTVKYNRIDTYPQTGIGQVLGLYLKPKVQIFDMAENGRSTKSFIARAYRAFPAAIISTAASFFPFLLNNPL